VRPPSQHLTTQGFPTSAVHQSSITRTQLEPPSAENQHRHDRTSLSASGARLLLSRAILWSDGITPRETTNVRIMR